MANIREAQVDSCEDWPADGLESVPNCPVCGSGERELLYEGLTDRVFFCAPGEWTLHRCQSCSSAYLDPRPTPETIGLAYRQYFTHEQNPGYGPLGLKGKLQRALANGYRNWRFGTRDTPSNPLGILLAALSPKHRAMLDAGMRHLPKPKPGQRLLDVGCGNGTFLLRARSAGWEVVGVDFDAKAVEVGRGQGLDVRLGGVDTLDPATEQFDVITLSHVIEHVHHPAEVLRACHRLLTLGGEIWIDTPNLDSEGHLRYGRNWRGLEPPRHLVLFTLDSLRGMLAMLEFGEAEIQAYRPLCAHLFRTSSAVAQGIDPYSASCSKMKLSSNLKISEQIARRDPARREFVTLKAWKR